jgi:hypothetical protein
MKSSLSFATRHQREQKRVIYDHRLNMTLQMALLMTALQMNVNGLSSKIKRMGDIMRRAGSLAQRMHLSLMNIGE